jgi:hypothetical protein
MDIRRRGLRFIPVPDWPAFTAAPAIRICVRNGATAPDVLARIESRDRNGSARHWQLFVMRGRTWIRSRQTPRFLFHRRARMFSWHTLWTLFVALTMSAKASPNPKRCIGNDS